MKWDDITITIGKKVYKGRGARAYIEGQYEGLVSRKVDKLVVLIVKQKTADKALVAELQARGLMLRVLTYDHSYPHCWRCRNPLIYYPQPPWYSRSTATKDTLLRENDKPNWYR